ncbi:hypothetical protein ACOME3_004319 [Neoechinorhynchus agilis]
MADHDDLIAEMPVVLQMTAEKRIQHARKRRLQQLKKWSCLEAGYADRGNSKQAKSSKIRFVSVEVLLDAVQRGDVNEVRQLMEEGVSPNIANADGFTAIHQCSLGDRSDILKLLLDNGANINIEDNDGWTPLHAAFACSRLGMVKTLIENGANLLSLDHERNFPFEVSNDDDALTFVTPLLSEKGITMEELEDIRQVPENKYLNRIRKRIKARPEINVLIERVDEQNATHLHVAAAYNFLKLANFLISSGAEIDPTDDQNWTPLHVAVYFSHQRMVELLLKNGANPERQTDTGLNAFDLCCDYEVRQWMFNFASHNRTADMKRRKTLPLRESDLMSARNNVRRYSLRENKRIRKHDDDFHFVISREDSLIDKSEEGSIASVESTETKNSSAQKEDFATVEHNNDVGSTMNGSGNIPLLFESRSNRQKENKCCLIV